MPESRSRGRPPRIDLDRVLDVAVSMGVSGLSMRGLARQLGVGVSTLYYYVQSRDELATMVADRTLEQLRLQLDDPRGWRHAMLRSAQALRMLFAGQPTMAEMALRQPTWGDTIVALHEETCAYLVRAGFSPGRAFLAVRAVADLVEAHTVRTHHHARAGFSDLLAATEAFGEHPTLDEAHRELGSDPSEPRFDFALRSLIRGMDPG